jgi:hypothetical protein
MRRGSSSKSWSRTAVRTIEQRRDASAAGALTMTVRTFRAVNPRRQRLEPHFTVATETTSRAR